MKIFILKQNYTKSPNIINKITIFKQQKLREVYEKFQFCVNTYTEKAIRITEGAN
jgi:hypothetical protein